MELLQIFIDNIAPIMIVSALGYLVGRKHHIDPKPFGRIIFYIFSPSLIFDSLSKNKVETTELAQIALIMLLFVSSMMVIAYVVARWRCPDRVQRAGLVLSAICPNNGNFGLPLIGFAFNEAVLARAVVVYVVVTFLNYTAGVFVASSGRETARQAFSNVLRVPMIYAAIAGFVVNSTGMTLPPVIARSAAVMAGAAVPAMLVMLGLQLAHAAQFSEMKLVSVGAGLRLLVSPLIAAALVLLLGMHGPASVAVIMQASMPVAVVTLIFASEFGLDDKLVSGTILTTTLLSPLTLSVLILLLRQTLSSGMP
jgi:malate permease and related proteins